MANDEFNIEELISGPEGSGRDVSRSNTRNTSNTGGSLHPFSVRLDQEYVNMIKALAWWKRISQREFIGHCINYALEDMDDDRLAKIISRYYEHSN